MQRLLRTYVICKLKLKLSYTGSATNFSPLSNLCGSNIQQLWTVPSSFPITQSSKFNLTHSDQLKSWYGIHSKTKSKLAKLLNEQARVSWFIGSFSRSLISNRMIRHQQTKFHETGAVTRRKYQRDRPVLTPARIDEILEFFIVNLKTSEVGNIVTACSSQGN